MKKLDSDDLKEALGISGAESLKDAIDAFKKALAVDMERVSRGETELTVLSSNNDDKVYNKILKLIVMFDSGKPLTMPIIERTEEEVTQEEKAIVKKRALQIEPGGNAWETAVTLAKKKASKQ